MKTTTLMLLLAVLVPTERLPAADVAKGWKVEVAGVRVVAVAPGSKNIDWELHGGDPGVTVVLMLTAPKEKIVGINTEESKLDSFTDDRGNSLMAGKKQSTGDSRISAQLGFGPLFGVSTSALVKVTVPNQPTKGATRFKILGKVIVRTASQTNQLTAENVEIKSGAKFSLGTLKLTVSNVRLLKKGECEVSLQAREDLSRVAHLDFYDEQGKKIESQANSSYFNASGADKQWTLGFTLKNTTDKAGITASCWSDLKSVEVPVSIKTGVGL